MSNSGNIDYDALAKQYGATSSAPQGGIDYDALAKQHGAISSTTYHGAVPKEVLDNLRAKSAEPTQFEKDREPALEESQTVRNPWAQIAHDAPGVMAATVKEVGNVAKSVPGMVSAGFEGPNGVASQAVQLGLKIGSEDAQRKQDGRSLPYRVVAGTGSAIGVNAKGMEDAADVGDYKKVLGTAAGDAAVAASPIAIEAGIKKFGPAVEKFSGSQVDKFNGPQTKVIPEAAGLPPKAISGAEDIYRAAAPTSKNAGFRENLYAAVPDLADIARKVKIDEAKGGIINPDMRVRATVDAIDSHLDQMYKTERAPQIQAHADVPVKVGTSPDSVRALEYLETTAGTEDVRALASKALGVEGQSGVRFAAKPLTLAEADALAQAANKYLKSYERAPSDVQMQMQQTSPKVGGLKSLDTELGRSIDDVLTSNGEVGIRDYERRYAALSEVRSQLRDRMNATELKQEGIFGAVGRVTRPIGKLLKEGPSGVPSASQAAVSDVNVGRTLQTGLQKLRETNVTAQRRR